MPYAGASGCRRYAGCAQAMPCTGALVRTDSSLCISRRRLRPAGWRLGHSPLRAERNPMPGLLVREIPMRTSRKSSADPTRQRQHDDRQQLISSCQGLVRNIAWRIQRKLPRHIEFDDLLGYAQLGLAQAACEFEPSRGVAFTTYAYYRIRGAIFDGLSEMAWFDFGAYHGGQYEPSISTSDDEEPLIDSTDAEEDSGPADPQVLIMHQELCAQLRQLVDKLPAEAGAMIRWAYYEGLSLTEASKRMGISKAWASRLHAQTLRRLAGALRQLGYT